jgi:pyruvate dehydrogenase E2 component (dihydrolipoamide acetyltransferase)
LYGKHYFIAGTVDIHALKSTATSGMRREDSNYMSEQIVLTALYPEMEEATLGRWRVTVGETVEEGQPIAELITDKVAYEYQSPAAGTVLAMLPAEKSVVPVGTVLAVVGRVDETVPELPQLLAENRRLSAAREASLTEILQATGAQSAPAASERGRAVRATPAARRLARERGVDLTTLTGSGPDGMISVDDIPEG